MPFAYFDRLNRRQQAIYLQSDAIPGMPLPDPARLRPLVAELQAALESGDRRLTESAAQLLATALGRALGVPRGPSLFGLGGFERHLVSVAIGRVIAHEVVHAVAPSVPHGTGLTAANLTRSQLRAPTIAVEAEVALAVQASLRGSPVFAPAATGVLAAQAEVPDKDR